MKQKTKILVSASAASILAFSALAQNTVNAPPERADHSRGGPTHDQRPNRPYEATKASDVIGMTVKNYQDEKLGKVENLGVDMESGRIVQVILSTGGFIGIGDRLTAVPPQVLRCDVAHKVLHLDASKETVKSAPRFEMSEWAEYSDSDHVTEVYRVWNKRPSTTPVPRVSQVQKGTQIMGATVKNLQNEKLGKVENMLLDLPSGRVVAVIISSGGFLGMGDELSAVPPTALRSSAEREVLQLDASKEMLRNAPHFKANQWPDLSQPDYADKVYRAYRVEPYVKGNDSVEPDNTGRNVRDRDGRTLTPLDQGGSRADRAITAEIRKEIRAEKNLSVNARNVKIITVNGLVTLRGPVSSTEEKRLIGEIAGRVAGQVDNQLEVNLTTSSTNKE